MSTEKLAEGIRKFEEDTVKLEKIILGMIEAKEVWVWERIEFNLIKPKFQIDFSLINKTFTLTWSKILLTHIFRIIPL